MGKNINRNFNGLFDPYKISKCDFILESIKKISRKNNENYVLLAICPSSEELIKASVVSAKKNNSPLLYAATLNQVDSDGGYTGLNFNKFVEMVDQEVGKNDYKGPVVIGIDHGGPWLKDKQSLENWNYDRCMNSVKNSFEEALLSGYELIHVDPTVDKTLPLGESISIEIVVDRTVELILHIENFRKTRNIKKISYEVGTEEVKGGVANIDIFKKFLELLKSKLINSGLEDIWPCFVVGKVGTDLHTTFFDIETAKMLISILKKYGSVLKGHYTDFVENPADYPKSGMGGANIGPELTIIEFETLDKLGKIEKKLFKEQKISKTSNIIEVISKAVLDSDRWKKWLNKDEKFLGFNQLSSERRDWLIKTGARYILANSEVTSAKKILRPNLSKNNIDSEKILTDAIVKGLDKYFSAYNLIDLNSKLLKELN